MLQPLHIDCTTALHKQPPPGPTCCASFVACRAALQLHDKSVVSLEIDSRPTSRAAEQSAFHSGEQVHLDLIHSHLVMLVKY